MLSYARAYRQGPVKLPLGKTLENQVWRYASAERAQYIEAFDFAKVGWSPCSSLDTIG